jgi:hypothetical protein
MILKRVSLFHFSHSLRQPEPPIRMRSFSIKQLAAAAVLVVGLAGACSVAESKSTSEPKLAVNQPPGANSSEPKGASIPIDANGPADTVREFYRLLREKKFREAIFLTNMRPAIEGLTDPELKDFSLDFETLAGQVPAVIEINGEIVTGDNATVTLMMPSDDGDKKELQTIKLRKDNNVWVILSVDEQAEKRIKQEGKNYFYALRIDTHEEEARQMLDRIVKAELAHSLQNGGAYADMQTLVTAGLLPDDIRSSRSTGYDYSIDLADKKYTASATPAEYGRSGKLSFFLQVDAKGIAHVTSKDNGGKPLRK